MERKVVFSVLLATLLFVTCMNPIKMTANREGEKGNYVSIQEGNRGNMSRVRKPVGMYQIEIDVLRNNTSQIQVNVSVEVTGLNKTTPLWNMTTLEELYAIQLSIVDTGLQQKKLVEKRMILGNVSLREEVSPNFTIVHTFASKNFTFTGIDLRGGSYKLKALVTVKRWVLTGLALTVLEYEGRAYTRVSIPRQEPAETENGQGDMSTLMLGTLIGIGIGMISITGFLLYRRYG